MRPVAGLQNVMLLQHRQGAPVAGVDLGGQGHQVHHDGRAQGQQAAEKHEQAEARRASQHGDQWRGHEDAGAQPLHRAQPVHQVLARLQRAVAAVVLHRMTDLVRGDRDGRQ